MSPPAINPGLAHHILRYTMALVFMSHGITRIVTDRVAPFGRGLDSWGFPYGIYWAWGVTIWEVVGGVLLILGVKAPWVALVFVVQMLVGIWFVHLKHGWFVVGHGVNGMEYSVTLIAALMATALTAPRR